MYTNVFLDIATNANRQNALYIACTQHQDHRFRRCFLCICQTIELHKLLTQIEFACALFLLLTISGEQFIDIHFLSNIIICLNSSHVKSVHIFYLSIVVIYFLQPPAALFICLYIVLELWRRQKFINNLNNTIQFGFCILFRLQSARILVALLPIRIQCLSNAHVVYFIYI